MFKLNPIHIRLSPPQRLYHCSVPIVAITGSIATGKSSVSKLLRSAGHVVFDADLLIKEVYKQQDIIDIVSAHCPIALNENKINFKVLRTQFFNDNSLKIILEQALYKGLEIKFREKAEHEIALGAEFIFYDVPLLFEKDLQDYVDLAVTVYAPRDFQLTRLQQRDNIDTEMAVKMINSQMDIEEKKLKSHLIINNQLTLKELEKEVIIFLDILKKN